MAKTSVNKQFNEILLESIDEAFLTLGENAKSSLYVHLQAKFSIDKQDIPERVDDFSDALDKIFGLAARHIEILIMRHLNQKVECTYDWVGPKWLVPDLTFPKYVEMVKHCVEEPEFESKVAFAAGVHNEQET